MNLAHASDMLLILANNQDELKKLDEILRENKLENKRKLILMNIDASKDYSDLLDKVIKENEIVRVFTKPIGNPVEKKAVVLKSGSIVRDMIERVNIAWLRNFKFARVFDNTKFSGRQVGLEYILKDKDIVEIHTH